MKKKKEAAPADQLAAALPAGIGSIFACMGTAEELIAEFKEKHPARAKAIDAMFSKLFPTLGMSQLDGRVYEAHCREMLEHCVLGLSVLPGTNAEVMVAISEASFKAPPGRTMADLYERLFIKVFGELPGGRKEPTAAGDYVERECAELFTRLSVKLASDRVPS